MEITADEHSLTNRRSGSRNSGIKKSSTTVLRLHSSKAINPFNHDVNTSKGLDTSKDTSRQTSALKKENSNLLRTLKKSKYVFKSELALHTQIIKSLNEALTLALPFVMTYGDNNEKEKIKKALKHKVTDKEDEYKQLQFKLLEGEREMNKLQKEVEALRGENVRLKRCFKGISQSNIKDKAIPTFLKSIIIDH